MNSDGDLDALDAAGRPAIAYYQATAKDLRLAHCGDPDCSTGTTVVTLDREGDVGQYASLALTPDGYPVVSYYDFTDFDLMLAFG